jgi:membrane associated rhomboid family serine protease
METGGVAFWAHIGGFVAGLLLIRLFAKPEHLLRRPTPAFALRDWR